MGPPAGYAGAPPSGSHDLREHKTSPLNSPEAKRFAARMGELIGYARCSTVLQDLTAQRQALASLGVPDDRIYLDKGLTGTSRARPGLDQALAAVRSGDTLSTYSLPTDRRTRTSKPGCHPLSAADPGDAWPSAVNDR